MTRDTKQVDRRRFLRVCGATAACGLAASSRAAAREIIPLIDTHVYVGRWPLRRLAGDTPTELATLLRRANVAQAWAGSFDGLFHKDIHGVNARLVETCRNDGDGMFLPIGAVNPLLPDWQEDLRRCHETFNMRGIRLHPTYHGYTLDDPRFARLLELAANGGMFVQLVVGLTDGLRGFLQPKTSAVDIARIPKTVGSNRGVRLLLSNVRTATAGIAGAARAGSIYVDVGHSSDGPQLKEYVDRVTADRVVYGSGAPLFAPATISKVLEQAKLAPRAAASISHANAKRLFGS
jgi:predicted TIM-barrel fold metal-dependent hydrolase